MSQKIPKEITPPKIGESTQEIAILPILSHCTSHNAEVSAVLSRAPSVSPEPTIPPIIACVVDTGKPFLLAKSSHAPAAKSALIIT